MRARPGDSDPLRPIMCLYVQFDYSLRHAAELPNVFRDLFIQRLLAACFFSHLPDERPKRTLRVDCDLRFAVGVKPSLDLGLAGEKVGHAAGPPRLPSVPAVSPAKESAL